MSSLCSNGIDQTDQDHSQLEEQDFKQHRNGSCEGNDFKFFLMIKFALYLGESQKIDHEDENIGN